MASDKHKTDKELSSIHEARVVAAKEFLNKRFLPPHIYNLLGLVGAVFLEDFSNIDDELLGEIEKCVRDKDFLGGDLTKSNSLKFFGCEKKDPSSFAFTFLDCRKLKKAANEAHDACEEFEKSLEAKQGKR